MATFLDMDRTWNDLHEDVYKTWTGVHGSGKKNLSLSNKFFFRLYHTKRTKEDDDSKAEEGQSQENFLFIPQEEWQQRLSKRFGSKLVFMDATYKTKCALPLFFVCVRPNVDYKVVAEFMTQYVGRSALSRSAIKALSILKSWNPLWQPKYFMVDFCTVEIGAFLKSRFLKQLPTFVIFTSCRHGSDV